MNDPFDPYAIVGVAKDATAELIRKAYRAKAKEVHPDAGGDAENFAALSRAFGILSDPSRRLSYDRTGQADDSPEGNLTAAALNTVRNIIDSAILRICNSGQNPLEHDLIEITKASIRQAITETVNNAATMRTGAENALKIAGRFHRADGDNFVRRMVEDKARDFNKKADFKDQEKKRLELALEIVSQYRFDFQAPQQHVLGGLGATFVAMRTA
jgi:curved DNA-binding protein CbpA